MANSSEWIDQVERAELDEPAWFASLRAREGFCEESPFAVASPERSISENGSVVHDVGSTEHGGKRALEKAFSDGEAAGRAAAQAEASVELAQRRELRLAFRALDQAALDSLASELSDTVLALCEQVLVTSAVDRDGLVKRCKAAAERIGGAAGRVVLKLHPEDIELLGEKALAEWHVQADPSQSRGSLVLEGDDGSVHDGPGEWRRAISEAVRG